MKKLILAMTMLATALVMTGCGNKADENKTPEQIKQEVTKMDASEIQSVIADYQKAIEEKTAELQKETEKLKGLDLSEVAGEKGKAIKDNMAELSKSIDKLKANMEAYAESQKKK
ncbi:MAG: hypothetical protein J5944_14325 [Lentisphaeria bacterium]|nr:hypothetical protein [Lentisphaeria bacterium]